MRKNVFGRQLKRDVNERKALFKGLLSALVLHGRIKTTQDKAKSIQGEADKLVTKSRKNKLLARGLLSLHLIPDAVEKMISEVAPRFDGRKGGYTRIIRLGERFSDNAKTVFLEWVDQGIENGKQKIENSLDKKSEDKEDHKEDKKETKKASRPKKKEIKTKEE